MPILSQKVLNAMVTKNKGVLNVYRLIAARYNDPDFWRKSVEGDCDA